MRDRLAPRKNARRQVRILNFNLIAELPRLSARE
jgi:hypothetical protein